MRAYKSIESEKKALEIALTAMVSETGQEKNSVKIDNEESNASSIEVLFKNFKLKIIFQTTQLEALKQAISTLTIENKKKEMALQSDRKTLIVSIF